MALSILADGAQLAGRVDPPAVAVTSRAEEGTIGSAALPAEDPAGDLATTGHRPLSVSETSCASPRLWTGWSADRSIGRQPDDGLLAGPLARVQEAAGVDLNAALGFRLVGEDGNRPAESIDARLAWLLGSTAMSGLVHNRGEVHTGFTEVVDASDLRAQPPSAVLSELAEAPLLRTNWFVYRDAATDSAALCWGRWDEAHLGLSALTVSNVQSDWSPTCFPPSLDARLARTPEDVYSDVAVQYRGGMAWASRPATATAFIRRGTTLSRPRITSAAAAVRAGQQFLALHAAEHDRVTLAILVPAASAGLVRAGQRIAVRLSEMPGYADWRTLHVAACSPRPADGTGAEWLVDLELVEPAPWTPEPLSATLMEMRLRQGESCDRFWGYPGPLMATGTPESPPYGHAGSRPPTSGAVEYAVSDDNRCGVPMPVAIRLTGAGTVDARLRAGAVGVGIDGGATTRFALLRNGVEIGSGAPEGWGDLKPVGASCDFTVPGVRVEPGDVISGWLHVTGSIAYLAVDDMAYGAAGTTSLQVDGSAVPQAPGSSVSDAPGQEQVVHGRPPGPTDDSDHGRLPGTVWIDSATGLPYLLVDAAPGAAVWVQLPAGPGGTVSDERPLGIAPSAGASGRYSRADHTHGSPSATALGAAGVRGELLVSDSPAGSPLVFADLLQAEDGADMLYADLEVPL